MTTYESPGRSGHLMLFASLLLAIALIATSCGGGGGNGGGTQQGAADEGREIMMASGDNWFDPDTLTVSEGETITIVVSNDGVLTHNISVDEFNVSKDYRPGETVRVTFTPNRTGEFEFYCDEPGHREAGMYGTLIVTSS